MIPLYDNELPARIQAVYSSCSAVEQEWLKRILYELSMHGKSQTYEDIWLADYKEMPVDINTFICDDRFLGLTNRQGTAVYPFWHKTLNDIFSAGNKYEEVFFTGATRIGKSSTAITATAYMLYRLMCLRDPQDYFAKKEISKYSILFFNITKDLAKGVAYREFNDTLRDSPWFQEHGKFSLSERNFYYIPEGDKVIVDYGSDAAHALGQQVFVGFCLVGSTKICTADGIVAISELVDKPVQVMQMDLDIGTFDWVSAEVKCTHHVQDTVHIELADGSELEGTPEHPILFGDFKYHNLSEVHTDSLILTPKIDGGYRFALVTKVTPIHYVKAIPVYDVIEAKPHHNFLIYGGHSFIVSHNCDEINFSRAGVKDVLKAKQHMQDLYNTVADRVKGTFRLHGEVYGKIFAVSSKRSDSDFMEAYMQQQLDAGAGDHMYISDKPQWEVLPESMFHKEKFYIAVGDRHKKGFVVPDDTASNPTALDELRGQGYKLLTPPIDFRSQFIADFDIALRDLAGISVPGALSFITQESIAQCIDPTLHNPFFNEVLTIGTKDTYTIEEYFHKEVISPELFKYPMFIHLDLSLTTDRTGISGVCISGTKDIRNEDGKILAQPMFTHVFTLALEAPRGDKIPYSKILAFIVWLRKQKFNISRISRDQFQSEYMAQLLEEQGFDVDKISLDRTPDGYMAGRAILMEQRVRMIHVELLENELIHLQRDSNTGRVDHIIGRCLTGDTKISLVDGRELSILELIQEQQYKTNWVYTVNEQTHNIEPKRILNVFQTMSCTDLVRITLDTGESFECTPSHKIMLRDGSYLAASLLAEGQSIMPLYRRISKKGLRGYRMYYNPSDNNWHYEHRQFAERSIRKGEVVHHANYNKLDNCPSNLQVMSVANHTIIHNNSTLDYTKTSKSLKDYYKRIAGTDAERKRNEACRQGTLASYRKQGIYRADNIKARITEIEQTFNVEYDKLTASERNSYSVKLSRIKDPTIGKRIVDKVVQNHKLGKYDNAYAALSDRHWYTNGTDNIYIKSDEVIPDGYYKGRVISDATKAKQELAMRNMSDSTKAERNRKLSIDTSNRIWINNGVVNKYINKNAEIPEGFVRGRCNYVRNHKVAKVEFIHKPCHVYDLTIEDNPNFALSCGVFVHNSKDVSDSFVGAMWNAMLNNPGIPVSGKSIASAIAAINGMNGKDYNNPLARFGNYKKY